MRGGEGDCCVVVVGAGAAGALTASHLVTGAVPALPGGPGRPCADARVAGRRTPPRRPAPAQRARQRDERLPAGPRALLPLGAHPPRPQTQPQDFVPRRVYGDYVAGLLQTAAEYPGNARLDRATSPSPGSTAAATGSWSASPRGSRSSPAPSCSPPASRPGTDWAPAGSRDSDRLRRRPVDRRTLPDGDLLLVGTGLTMVDVAIAADRPGRTLHTVSRHDLVPAGAPRADHARRPAAARASPALGRSTSCTDVVRRHVARDRRRDRRLARRDRRPAPGHRPAVAGPGRGRQAPLPRRARPHAGTSTATGCPRSPPPARRDRRRRPAGAPHRHRGRRPRVAGGIEVTLTDGEQLTVGRRRQLHRPGRHARHDPLLAALARAGLVRPGPVRSRHRHRRRRPRARRAARAPAALRPRRPAARQPVGDHGDARDPRAGLRRGPFRRTRAARRDPAPPASTPTA